MERRNKMPLNIDMRKEFIIREIGRDEVFDPSTLCDTTPFTQAGFYGNWQRGIGRSARRFLVYGGISPVAYFQVITYPLAFGKAYSYIPYGPVASEYSDDLFVFLREELRRIAREEKAVFVRLDFTPVVAGSVLSQFFTKAPPYTYHSAHFQPRTEWVLELKGSEGEIFAGMHKKTRYSVRLSEQKGVAADIITSDFESYSEDFYSLMRETAERNGFRIHQKAYYEHVFQNLPQNSYLSVAKFGKKNLAIHLIIVYGNIATYVFGASSEEGNHRAPSYAAQWRAIKHARGLGCRLYNFGGISAGNDTHKGWDGLTMFKKKFGGREMTHSDFFDIVVHPLWYRAYNLRKWAKRFV